MSIEFKESDVAHIANGIITDFTFDFKVEDENDLLVKVKSSSVVTIPVIGADYTVTLNEGEGGTLSFLSAPSSGDVVFIFRNTDKTQTLEMNSSNTLFKRQLENSLDKLTLVTQENERQISRSLRVKDTDQSGVNPELDFENIPAGSMIKLNDAGDAIEAGPLASSIDNIDQTLLDAQAAQAAAESAQLAAETAQSGSETAETNAQGYEVAAQGYAQDAEDAAASSQWQNVEYLTFADSPRNITSADAGTFFVVDASAGNFVFNLPLISSLDLTGNLPKFGGKKSDATTNSVVINAAGTDEIDQSGQIISANVQNNGYRFIPDTDAAPDSWTTIAIATASGAANPALIEGSAYRVTASSSDALSSGGSVATDSVQIQRLTEVYEQWFGGQHRVTEDMDEERLRYSTNNITSSTTATLHKNLVNMSTPGQTITVVNSSYQGYYQKFVKTGGEPCVIVPNSGSILGYPNGFSLVEDGDAVCLWQVAVDQIKVVGSNLKLSSPELVDTKSSSPEVDLSGWTFTQATGATGGSATRNTTSPLSGNADIAIQSNADRTSYSQSTVLNISDLTEFDRLSYTFSVENEINKEQRIKCSFPWKFEEDKVGHAQIFVGLFRTDTGALIEAFDFDGRVADIDTANPLRGTGGNSIGADIQKGLFSFDCSGAVGVDQFTLVLFTAEGDPLAESVGNIIYKVGSLSISTEELKEVGNDVSFEGVVDASVNWGITNSISSGVSEDVAANIVREDTHNQWTFGGTNPDRFGTFTAKYDLDADVSCNVQTEPSSFSQGHQIRLAAFVNGVFTKVLGLDYVPYTSASFPAATNGSGYIKLNAGDTLNIRIFQNSGSGVHLEYGSSPEVRNWLCIKYKKRT